MCLICTNIRPQSPQLVRPFCPLTPPATWRQSKENSLLSWLNNHKRPKNSDGQITCTALSGGVYFWPADQEAEFLQRLAAAIKQGYLPSQEHNNGIPIFVVPQRTTPCWPLVFDIDMKQRMDEEDIAKLKQICQQNQWPWEEFSCGGMLGKISAQKLQQYQDFCKVVENNFASSYKMDRSNFWMLANRMAGHLAVVLRTSIHVFVAVTTPRVQCNGKGDILICNGLHLHLPDVIVDAARATYLRQQLIARLCADTELLSFIGGADTTPSAFWEKVVDPKLTASPNVSNGLRPLFASKCTFVGHVRDCTCMEGAHVTSSGNFSLLCKTGGWLYNPCVYRPGYVFATSRDGVVDQDESLTRRFTDPANLLWALQKTSIRAYNSSNYAVNIGTIGDANHHEHSASEVDPRSVGAPIGVGASMERAVIKNQPPRSLPTRDEMLVAIQSLPTHEAKQLLMEASTMVAQKEQQERELQEYPAIHGRRNRRSQLVAPPPFLITNSGTLEQFLEPRLSHVKRRRDVPDSANQMRVWRYNGDYSRTYSWPIQEHDQFLQALTGAKNEPHYFIEGRSFPAWRFFLDLDASVAFRTEHIPLVCLGNSPRRPWNEPCCCDSQKHQIPDILMAKDVHPREIDRHLSLSSRLEQLMEQCPEYKNTCATSLLKQAAAIVRALGLDSLVYVTATQPRLERFGNAFIIRHGLHLHFYNVIVDQHLATHLRHACIERLADDENISASLQVDKGQPLAGHFSSLLDPCAVTDPASGTGARFLHQYKALWTPASAGICSCPKRIKDPNQYCSACKNNWVVVVQHYKPCQVLDSHGQLLSKESEVFVDAQNLLRALEKCSVHAPPSERNFHSSPRFSRSPPSTQSQVLLTVQQIIQQVFVELPVEIESVWLVNTGSEFPTIHAQGKSHKCLNIASTSTEVAEHVDRERPFWTLGLSQISSTDATITVQYHCRSRYKNPTTGVRCLDLNSCHALQLARTARMHENRVLSIFKSVLDATNTKENKKQDEFLPAPKRVNNTNVPDCAAPQDIRDSATAPAS